MGRLMTEGSAEDRSSLQTHGNNSTVYVPILLAIFTEKYTVGDVELTFTLDDVRRVATDLGITIRNPADLVYRMRSRTKLPKQIVDKGFRILRQVGRGRYRLEFAETTIFDLPDIDSQEALDLTPMPVRRLLPEDIGSIDEQALLTIVGYSKLLNHFTGLTVYRLRSHVRKSVEGVGQAELDELDVGVALRDDEMPIILPIEAKAAPDAINRVQIAAQVAMTRQYYPDFEIRPLAIKLDWEGTIHLAEFNPTATPADLEIVQHVRYRLKLSDAVRTAIRDTPMVL